MINTPEFPAINDVVRVIGAARTIREAVESLQTHDLWPRGDTSVDEAELDTLNEKALSAIVSIAGLSRGTMAAADALAESYADGLRRLYEPARYPTRITWCVEDPMSDPEARDPEQVRGFSEPATAASLGLSLRCIDRERVVIGVPLAWCECPRLRPAMWATPRPALRAVARAIGAIAKLDDAVAALRACDLWPANAPPVKDLDALVSAASLGVPMMLAVRALSHERARAAMVAKNMSWPTEAWDELPWSTMAGPPTKDDVGPENIDNAAAVLCGATFMLGVDPDCGVMYSVCVPRVTHADWAAARR